jgi:hypothetical protein
MSNATTLAAPVGRPRTLFFLTTMGDSPWIAVDLFLSLVDPKANCDALQVTGSVGKADLTANPPVPIWGQMSTFRCQAAMPDVACKFTVSNRKRKGR